MTSSSVATATASIFVVCVAAYAGMRWWTFEHFRTSYVTQFVLASALAIAVVRGGESARWLTAMISACGAVSAFKMALYPYPDGSTAHGLIVPGVGFTLCAIALLTSEVVRYFSKSRSTTE